jgi:hypothetical protein
MGSRRSAFSIAGKCGAGLPDRGWIDASARGERK